jgi:hypothetical protein
LILSIAVQLHIRQIPQSQRLQVGKAQTTDGMGGIYDRIAALVSIQITVIHGSDACTIHYNDYGSFGHNKNPPLIWVLNAPENFKHADGIAGILPADDCG